MKTTPTPTEKQQAAQRKRLEDLLDKALADTFPASDPVSHLVPEDPQTKAGGKGKKGRRE